MFSCIDANEKRRRQEANIRAVTDARGWAGLFNGFAGKDGQKIHPYQLLPFPEEVTQDDKRTLSNQTMEIFERLLKQRKLHPVVVGAVLSQSAELRKMLEVD